MAFLRDKVAFLMKLESTMGTPVTPAAVDFDLAVYEPEYTPMIEMDGNLRPAIGSHAELKDISGARAGQIKFKMKLGPSTSGGTAPKWGKVMKACGLDETDYGITGTSYSPIAACDEICASLEIVKISRSGSPTAIIQKIAGAMGNCVLSCAGIGKPLEGEFTFLGKYIAQQNVSNADLTTLNVLTAPDQVDPYTLRGATYSAFGVNMKISSFKLDYGNKIELEIDPADANGGCYRCAGITERKPKFSANPLISQSAVIDPVLDMAANTTGTITLVLDSAGSIPFTITMPVAQIIDAKSAVRENLEAWDLNYKLEANGLPSAKIVSTLDWEETFELLHGAKA